MALLGAFNGQVSSRNHTFDHFDAKNNISSHFKSKHEQYILLTTCRVAFFDFPEPGSENNKGPLPKLFSNEGPIQVLHHTFELFPFENSFGGVLVAVGTNTASKV